MTNPIGNQLVRATLARFEAARQESLATIELYLNAAVGVSEHPNVVSELAGAVTKLAAAEEALDSLDRNFLRAQVDNSDNMVSGPDSAAEDD